MDRSGPGREGCFLFTTATATRAHTHGLKN